MDRMTWNHTCWCPRTWTNAAVPGTDRRFHNLAYEPGICSCARHASVEPATERLGVLKRFDAQTRSRLTFWDKTTPKETSHGPRCRPRYTRPLTVRRSRGAASTGSVRRAQRCVWSAWHDHGPGSVCKLGARSDKTRVSSPVRHRSLDVQMRTPLPIVG